MKQFRLYPRQMLLFLFFFLEIDGKRDVDRLFFHRREIHKSFIPANPLNAIGTEPLKAFHERKWPMKDSRFRLSFNPLRCEGGNEAKNHTMIISLLEDHLPTEPTTLKDLLLNSIVLSGSKTMKSAKEAAFQKFQYSLIQRSNGTKYPDEDPFEGLFFNMYTGHFYVEINRPYLTVYFFDEDSGEVKFRFSIASSTARFFTIYANYFGNCPLFISIIDGNFPDWVPGKNMTIRRGSAPKYESKSTFSSVLLASIIIGIVFLLTKTLIVHWVISFILPRIGRPLQAGGMHRKLDYGSDFGDPSNLIGDDPTSPKTGMAGGEVYLPSTEALRKLVMSVRTRNAKKKTPSSRVPKTQTTQQTPQTTQQITTQQLATTPLEQNEVTGEAAELEEEDTQPDT